MMKTLRFSSSSSCHVYWIFMWLWHSRGCRVIISKQTCQDIINRRYLAVDMIHSNEECDAITPEIVVIVISCCAQAINHNRS